MKQLIFILMFTCSPIVGMTFGEQVISAAPKQPVRIEYTNPIIHADYSDPDVVAAPDGKTFYMTASSFQCVPGLPILKSENLVDWRVVNHALDTVPPADFYGAGIPRHGKGVWAPCIRYHNGEYYIYWGDPDFGIFMVKSADTEGRWSSPVLVREGKGLIDPTPFWDEDGKAYLANGWAASRAGFNSVITISEMNPEGTRVIGWPRIVYDGNDGVNHTVEGPKMYKRGDYYYLFAPAGGVENGWQLVMRSKNVYGPYESKIVMAQGTSDINGPHQGAWIDNYFLHFQDKGAYGRIIHLNPLTWVNDWPVIGVDKEGKGCGEPVREYVMTLSNPDSKPSRPAGKTSDNGGDIGRLFQWNANYSDFFGFPIPGGLMRLYSQPYDTNMWLVPNLWLMKLPAEEFTFTGEVTVSAKAKTEGVSSGITVMGLDYCRLGLTENNGKFALQLVECHDAENGGAESVRYITTLKPDRTYEAGLIPNMECRVWLRVTVKKGGVCTFSYSTDGRKFKKISGSFTARQGKWIGAKVGFYSIMPPEIKDRGWVDVKSVKIE